MSNVTLSFPGAVYPQIIITGRSGFEEHLITIYGYILDCLDEFKLYLITFKNVFIHRFATRLKRG